MNTQTSPSFIIEEELENKLATYQQNNDETVSVYENEADELYFVLGYN